MSDDFRTRSCFSAFVFILIFGVAFFVNVEFVFSLNCVFFGERNVIDDVVFVILYVIVILVFGKMC